MSALVPYPPQPFYWLLPEMVAKLEAAAQRRGRTLLLYTGDPRGLLSAWRSYAQQNTLYQAALHGGNVASPPDSGPRSHMRGTAGDLALTDAATQQACRDVGLIRDLSESWHWNLPGFLNYPIIPVNTAAAGGGATLIQKRGESTMTDFILYAQTDMGAAATVAADGVAVAQESAWYCEAPGAPGFPLGTLAATNVAGTIAYQAFAADNPDLSSKRLAKPAKDIAKYLVKYGTTTKPIGNFAGATTIGDVTVPADPALLAAVQANNAALLQLVAATKALNPPG